MANLLPIPSEWYTDPAETSFARAYNNEGSYYCPDCGDNQGSVWYHDAWRPTKIQALCYKCKPKYSKTSTRDNKEPVMAYNFDFAVSATIDAKTVEEMVKRVVETQTGRKVKSVSFKHRQESDYMDRFSTTVFDGCTVTFEVDSKTEAAKFIPTWKDL